MTASITSGTAPFTFKLRDDLHQLPADIAINESHFHTMLAEDDATGNLYYGLLNIGLVRLSADMQQHHILDLPDDLKSLNFHSVKIGRINNQKRLFLTANDAEQVIVTDLEGTVDFIIPRPDIAPYADSDMTYKPTDTLQVGNRLYIADGYAAQIISIFDLEARTWLGYFGGHTEDRNENGKFRTAHAITLTPDKQNLLITDRWNSRLQIHDFEGEFIASHRLPYNAWLCSIDLIDWHGQQLGVIACLYDVDEDKKRPAPIFIVDMSTYEIISTIRVKDDLGVNTAQRIHHAKWHVYDNNLYIVGHSWNTGRFFILEQITT